MSSDIDDSLVKEEARFDSANSANSLILALVDIIGLLLLYLTTMITPRFSCAQTAESVIISIYCPSVRVRAS